MHSNGAVPVKLPGGFWRDGERYQEAAVRPLVGRDEAALGTGDTPSSRAEWTTKVLGRCVESLGPLDVDDIEPIRSLTVGDREALLLHVRRLTLGNALPSIVSCPACAEKMDLELSAAELLLRPDPHETQVYEATIGEDGQPFAVAFRLPTGGDQEVISGLAAESPEEAARLLVHRCVDDVRDEHDEIIAEAEWPASLIGELSDRMQTLDPQAELTIDTECPFCDHSFGVLFDTATYFSKELAQREERFYREVHTLAFYYHWSEEEIMNLTLPERHRYIELINRTLSEGRHL